VKAFIQTDKQYKEMVAAELDRNIRVLQFYVWISRYPWTGDIHMTNTLAPYINFVNSQSVRLQEIYSIDLLGEILRLYKTFDLANRRIEVINSSIQPLDARSHAQNADFLKSTINKSIQILINIYDSLGHNGYRAKTYLSDEWENENILLLNSRQFIKAEQREMATGPVVEFKE